MKTASEKLEYMRGWREKNKVKVNADKLLQTRKKRLENKLKAIEFLGGRCNSCGQVFDIWVYDFHHLNPEDKLCDPGSLMHLSWKSVQEEVKKCILLCANCHRTVHYKGDL
jgi:hypothetical protein